MTNTSKTVLGIVVVVIIVVIVALTSGGASEKGPIKIGFVGPLSADAATLGQASRTAVEIAIDEVNKSGGINGRMLEGVYEDGKCSSAPALSAAQKLINVDKVSAIIGGLCSSETSSFVKVAMEAKIPTIAYCSSAPTLSGSGKYFFRTYPSDAFQGKFAAEYSYNTLKAKKVAVLYHTSDWGNGIKDVFISRFKELGGAIVAEESSVKESRDYKTNLLKIKDANPDLIYIVAYPEGGAVAVQQVADLGIKVPVIGGETFDDPNFQKSIPKTADILYTIAVSPQSDEFKAKMTTKIGGDSVPVCASQAYDAMTALVNAYKKVGTDSDKAVEVIRVSEFEGISGHIKFEQNGDLSTANYEVKHIMNNKVVPVQ